MKFHHAFIATTLIACGSTLAFAEGGSQERGRELFESVKLGKNGKSCASCHPGGRKLEWAGTYDEARLSEITNRCIVKALQGKALAEDSDDLKSLVLYLKSLAGPDSK